MNIICDSVLKVKMCVQYIILNYYNDDTLEFGQTLLLITAIQTDLKTHFIHLYHGILQVTFWIVFSVLSNELKWFILMLLIDVTFKKSCFIILRMSFAYPADGS